MAKSTNHTAHNQSYKAHRNGKRKVARLFTRRVVGSFAKVDCAESQMRGERSAFAGLSFCGVISGK